MKRVGVLILLLVLGLSAANARVPIVHAATLTVPSGSFPTIQSAVNAANPGDTITILPGTYPENVLVCCFDSPGLTINGSGQTNTVIDGGCNGSSTVTIEASIVTIQRVTILNGCVLTGGGGVENRDDSSTLIIHSTIKNGFVAECCAGGASNEGGSSLNLSDTIVTGNESAALGAGGVANFGFGFSGTPVCSAPRQCPVAPQPAHQDLTARRDAARSAGHSAAHAGTASSYAPGTGPGKAHRQSATAPRRAPAAVGLVGSTANGTGLTIEKGSQVTNNASELGSGGIASSGTAQVVGASVNGNLGGGVGGAANGEDSATGSLTFRLSQLSSNTSFGSPTCDCAVGGLWGDAPFFFSDTTIKNNVVNNCCGFPQAGAIGLVGDSDDVGYVHITRTVITGNTPPQCLNFGGSGDPLTC